MNRLDIVLGDIFPYSRSQLQKFIRSGAVKVNNEVVRDPSYKVTYDDKFLLREIEKREFTQKSVPKLNVIFQDENLLVLNKEQGTVVHPSVSHESGTLVDALVENYPFIANIGGNGRSGIVHRLDKDTSGALLIAKNQTTFIYLSSLFKSRKINKIYYAVVSGILREPKKIETLIGRNPKNRLKQAVVQEKGKNAYTSIEPVKVVNNISLVKLMPKTGRMHQLRVHLKYINHPIVGDKVYGIDKEKFMMLHAYSIEFPYNSKQVKFTAPFPKYWKEYIQDVEIG